MQGLNKIVGSLLGFLFVGLPGLLVGLIVGHVLDQLGVFTSGLDESRGRLAESSELRQIQIKAAYRLLQISPSATPLEIKEKYRRLIGRYHPDRLAQQVLDPDKYHEAAERGKRIKEAYDLICQSRHF